MEYLNHLPIWHDANRLLLAIEQAVHLFPKRTIAMRKPRIAAIVMGCLLLAGLPPVLAQTCRTDIPASAPDSHFRDNGDGTVLDMATGLIWKQCSEGLSGVACTTGSLEAFTWQQALQRAADAVFAGSSLWRLPNKNELASLVEQRCCDPAINSRFFPNTPGGWFWSSSPFAGGPGSAWSVDFGSGYVHYFLRVGAPYVRLVRGGQ